jgi:acyl carrier protein
MPWHDGNFDSDPRVAQILAIVAKEAAVDRAKLNRDATIEELGIDSLDLTMTVFQLETVFDINIPAIAEQAGAEFAMVGDLVQHVIAAIDKADRENAGDRRSDPREQPAPEVSGATK